jgi:hypothetical protein
MKVQPGLHFCSRTLLQTVSRFSSLTAVGCRAAFLLCTLVPYVGGAQTLTTLANFNGNNGANPFFAPPPSGHGR